MQTKDTLCYGDIVYINLEDNSLNEYLTLSGTSILFPSIHPIKGFKLFHSGFFDSIFQIYPKMSHNFTSHHEDSDEKLNFQKKWDKKMSNCKP